MNKIEFILGHISENMNTSSTPTTTADVRALVIDFFYVIFPISTSTMMEMVQIRR